MVVSPPHACVPRRLLDEIGQQLVSKVGPVEFNLCPYSANKEVIGRLRQELQTVLGDKPPDRVFDAALVYDELLANAVTHGCDYEGEFYAGSLLSGKHISMAVINPSKVPLPDDWQTWPMPDPQNFGKGGRGVVISRNLSDLTYVQQPGWIGAIAVFSL